MKILGILYLNNKTTYIGEKGEKLKKFISIYDNKEYLVKTKKESLQQLYCVIDSETNDVIEYINDLNNDYKMMPEKLGLINWSMKINNYYNKNIDIIKNIDLTPKRINYLDNNIISVDPINCNDIDDAIHIDNYNDSYINIYIHISDPSSYFDIDSDIDNELLKRTSSLYLDKTYHMIPEKIATDIISLKQNEIKRSFTCKIILPNNKKDIYDILKNKNINYEFIKTNIIVKNNLNYDDFENQLDNIYYKKIYDIGKIIIDGLNIEYDNYDSHKMIEAYMILCNICASYKSILKRANIFIKNDELMQYNKYNQSYAFYTLDNLKHEGINSYYTHFTSPIRRYSDIVVHRLIYNDIINCKLNSKLNNIFNSKLINILNYNTKYYKKVYNIYNLLKILNGNNFIEIKGKIVNIGNNILKILVDNKLLITKIVNKKLLDNYTVKIENDNISTYIYYKDKKIEYKISENISLKIYFIKNNIYPFKILLNDFELET